MRWIALLAAGWLVASGVFAGWHAAETPHVRGADGRVFHGVVNARPGGDVEHTRLAERGSGLHDHRACSLASTHAGGIAPAPVVSVATFVAFKAVRTVPAATAVARRDLYRLAPKTSPPKA
ncbi:MAG: hypothetical protein SFX73_30315 [Kofleriaceae bacterium]|nr:hypothetical protein [Kofleriaceae bacterium]